MTAMSAVEKDKRRRRNSDLAYMAQEKARLHCPMTRADCYQFQRIPCKGGFRIRRKSV